jgi:predicted CoA-binding protein
MIDMADMNDALSDEQVRARLRTARRIAVVGLSPRPERPSYGVAEYLKRQGYTIYPINPTQLDRNILGEKVYGSLSDLPEAPDIVDVFRRSAYLPDVVEAAIAARSRWQREGDRARAKTPQVLWTQLDVVHEGALRRARAAGFIVVADRCLKVEHMRLGVGAVHNEN